MVWPWLLSMKDFLKPGAKPKSIPPQDMEEKTQQKVLTPYSVPVSQTCHFAGEKGGKANKYHKSLWDLGLWPRREENLSSSTQYQRPANLYLTKWQQWPDICRMRDTGRVQIPSRSLEHTNQIIYLANRGPGGNCALKQKQILRSDIPFGLQPCMRGGCNPCSVLGTSSLCFTNQELYQESREQHTR